MRVARHDGAYVGDYVGDCACAKAIPSGLNSCIHNFVKALYVCRLSEEERSLSSLTQGFIRDCAGFIVCYTPCNTRENLPAEAG